ncbi:MAG: phosphatase PAP2 family protein [Bacteroidota bacterium]
MKKALPFLFLLFLWISSSHQLLAQIQIASIHPLAKVKNHYQELQQLDAAPRTDHAWMDTLAYPPELYTGYTLLFTQVKPHYLSESQVEFLVESVQFPANSSQQTRAELDWLLELQEKRTDLQSQAVMEIASIGYWPDANLLPSNPRYRENLTELFYEGQEILGPDCTAENYPMTAKLLQGVMLDMRLMEFAVKYHLLRARPYQLDPRIEPLREIRSPSFASGHTLWAYIQAYTWGELLPEKRSEFVDLAYEIALSREIMGVHYPSDEEAARQLAHRMLLLMWHTADFQRDFAVAKAEWK